MSGFSTPWSAQIEDLVSTYEGIIKDADAVLLESRIASSLPVPALPDGLEGHVRWSDHNDPLPPEDLTEVPNIVIGKLFSFFQNWTNYVSAETTRAKLIRDVQSGHLAVVQSALSIYYREEEERPAGTVPDYVRVDLRYVSVDASLMRIKVYHETAKSRYEQLKRVLNNVSREQTRRREELERTMHDEYGGRDAKAPTSRDGGPKRMRTFRK